MPGWDSLTGLVTLFMIVVRIAVTFIAIKDDVESINRPCVVSSAEEDKSKIV